MLYAQLVRRLNQDPPAREHGVLFAEIPRQDDVTHGTCVLLDFLRGAVTGAVVDEQDGACDAAVVAGDQLVETLE